MPESTIKRLVLTVSLAVPAFILYVVTRPLYGASRWQMKTLPFPVLGIQLSASGIFELACAEMFSSAISLVSGASRSKVTLSYLVAMTPSRGSGASLRAAAFRPCRAISVRFTPLLLMGNVWLREVWIPTSGFGIPCLGELFCLLASILSSS